MNRAGFDELRRIIREEEPRRPSVHVSTLRAEQLTTVSSQRRMNTNRLSHVLAGELDWIVMKALEKDRTRRFETAASLADDVKRYLAKEPVQACPPTTAYRLSKFVKRHQAGIAVTIAILLLLIIGSAATTWQAVLAIQEKDRATKEKNRAVAAEALAQKRLEESENARAQSDQDRRIAVAAQKKAEAARKEAEAARAEAEIARMDAEANCLAYLNQLRVMAAAGGISKKDSSKQLREFPLQHAALLLLETHDSESPLHGVSPFWDRAWVAQIKLDEIEPARKAVVKAFEKQPHLMKWIVAFGWAEDIRDHIITKVIQDARNIDQNYFQLAVDLADPKLYPMLHETTMRSPWPMVQIKMLRGLPGYDLNRTITRKWDRGGIVFDRRKWPLLLPSRDPLSALKFMVGMLKGSGGPWRERVLNVIAFRGTDQEIVAWYESNHAELVFDQELRCFLLPGDEVPSNLDADRRKQILQRWQKGEKALGKEALNVAVSAARCGDRTALDYVMDKLKIPKVNATSMCEDGRRYQRYTNVHRNAARRVVAFRGSNREIVDWYNMHKHQIEFDPVSSRFILRDEK